jgi:hypothetical protein
MAMQGFHSSIADPPCSEVTVRGGKNEWNIEDRGVSVAFLRRLTSTSLADPAMAVTATTAFTEYVNGKEEELGSLQVQLELDATENGSLQAEVAEQLRVQVAEKEGALCKLRKDRKAREAGNPYLTTRDVHRYLVVAETSGPMCRFLELDDKVEEGDVGKADCFVSHSWDSPWEDLVSALEAHTSDSTVHRNRAAASPEQKKALYYWIDIFAVNQHCSLPPWICQTGLGPECHGCAALRADMHDWENADSANLRGFERVIEHTQHTLVVMEPWDDPRPPRRVWCLFEGYQTLARGGQLEVVLGWRQQRELQAWLGERYIELEGIISGIDARAAEATAERDRDNIFAAIERLPGGFDGLNEKIRLAQKTWLADAAEGALRRTDRNRPPLETVALELERAEIGPAGARMTVLLECQPWLVEAVKQTGYAIWGIAVLLLWMVWDRSQTLRGGWVGLVVLHCFNVYCIDRLHSWSWSTPGLDAFVFWIYASVRMLRWWELFVPIFLFMVTGCGPVHEFFFSWSRPVTDKSCFRLRVFVGLNRLIALTKLNQLLSLTTVLILGSVRAVPDTCVLSMFIGGGKSTLPSPFEVVQTVYSFVSDFAAPLPAIVSELETPDQHGWFQWFEWGLIAVLCVTLCMLVPCVVHMCCWGIVACVVGAFLVSKIYVTTWVATWVMDEFGTWAFRELTTGPWGLVVIDLVLTATRLRDLSNHMATHQKNRLLRQPRYSLCTLCSWLDPLLVAVLLCLTSLAGVWIWGPWLILAIMVLLIVMVTIDRGYDGHAASASFVRASLCAKIASLRLSLNQTDESSGLLDLMESELNQLSSASSAPTHSVHCWLAAAQQIHAACKQGNTTMGPMQQCALSDLMHREALDQSDPKSKTGVYYLLLRIELTLSGESTSIADAKILGYLEDTLASEKEKINYAERFASEFQNLPGWDAYLDRMSASPEANERWLANSTTIVKRTKETVFELSATDLNSVLLSKKLSFAKEESYGLEVPDSEKRRLLLVSYFDHPAWAFGFGANQLPTGAQARALRLRKISPPPEPEPTPASEPEPELEPQPELELERMEGAQVASLPVTNDATRSVYAWSHIKIVVVRVFACDNIIYDPTTCGVRD